MQLALSESGYSLSSACSLEVLVSQTQDGESGFGRLLPVLALSSSSTSCVQR